MNHLGDSNKMVSETPRTDKEAFFPPEAKYNICDADFARTLERELNAAQQRIKRLESVENSHAHVLNAIDNWMQQHQSKEGKP